MTRIDNILVIVDPTAQTHPAVDKAVAIAKRCEARIELFACETRNSREARYSAHLAAGARSEFIADVRALVQPLAEAARLQGVDVCVETDCGDPLHAKLLERTQRTSADLVVKDTHHHSLARRTILTNTDWELIRGCTVPLLLTRPRPYSEPPVISAAVDPGHSNDTAEILNRRILEVAQLFATRFGGSLDLVNAFIPFTIAARAAGGSPAIVTTLDAKMLEELRSARQAEVAALAQSCGVGKPKAHVKLGVASAVLPVAAEEIRADIMVMGAVSRSGMQRLFIGNTAESVLERIECDVLIVKPVDFAAAMAF